MVEYHSLPRRYKRVVITKKYMTLINGVWKRQARSFALKYRQYCCACGEKKFARIWQELN